MKFKQFSEIWDYLSDPNSLPVVMGAAGMGGAALAKAGKWAMDKITGPSRDAQAMKVAFQELMQTAEQQGADSPQVRQLIDEIRQRWPGLESMAQRQVDQIRQQQPDDGNILPMTRSPQVARTSPRQVQAYRS